MTTNNTNALRHDPLNDVYVLPVSSGLDALQVTVSYPMRWIDYEFEFEFNGVTASLTAGGRPVGFLKGQVYGTSNYEVRATDCRLVAVGDPDGNPLTIYVSVTIERTDGTGVPEQHEFQVPGSLLLDGDRDSLRELCSAMRDEAECRAAIWG